ncbi:MAG: hypothetical protein K9J04_00230, partial [Burkholderiales bacterium]|nr:hypothetical protein [Burkholderiales bacterium]
PPPPSPVAAEKPPTPQDAADRGDKTLAAAAPPPPPKTAPQEMRVIARIESVAEGISVAQPVPPKLPGAPGVDGRFSLSGNTNAW